MKNRVYNGSITVFLSLLLVVLISLVTVSLESAHLSAVRGQIGMGSEAAMYTLFSHFEKSLYDDYKLLFLNDRQDFVQILKDEMELYEQTDTISQGTNHLRFGTESISVSDKIYLTDDNGKAFQEEINQILAGDMVAMVKNSISGNLKKLSQSGKTAEYMNLIMEQGAEIEDMSAWISKAAEKANLTGEGMEELERNTVSSLRAAEKYRTVLEKRKEGILSEYEVLQQKNNLEKELNTLSKDKQQLEQELEGIVENLKSYEKSAEQVNAGLEDINKKLQDEELEESYRITLYEELKSILDMTSESGDSYQQIAAARKQAEKNLKQLKSLQIPSSGDFSQEEILNGNVEKMLQQAKNAIGKCSSVEITAAKTEVDSKAGFSGKSLLKTVQKLITGGVFPIIVDNETKLSARTVDMKDLPSLGKKENTANNEKGLFETAVDNSKDTLALNIYLTEYIKCYEDKGNYDLEYILGKSKSDKENLKSVVNQLIYLRQAMNLMYLLSNEVKKQQARTAAAAMLAVTGNAAFIQAMTMVLLTAWAYAEAVSDVRLLINGKNIDFIKTSESWNLSLKQAADYRNWTRESNSAGKTGMSYKEYLRVLLFFHSRNVNMFRALDIIQWNICQKDPDFRISQCVYSLEADFSLLVKPVFFLTGGLKISGDVSGYTYEHKELKKYG
ncbi:MAG: DUF5702 domain-containing protein [Lachnospiraceae bacterium]|nr:DUF5702 domain-containing protein [Lachnospiraceae bacterium]